MLHVLPLGMSSFMIKMRMKDVQRQLDGATDAEEIARLKKSLQDWKWILHDAEMIEREERVGFKSMERNAGVWDEE